MKIKNSILLIYIFGMLLLMVLPINGKESKANHTFILHVRLDYIYHILVFLPWMNFLLIKKITNPLVWAFLGSIAVILMESVQYFLPYRAFNLNDIMSNSIGLILGAVIFYIINLMRAKREIYNSKIRVVNSTTLK